MSSPTPQWQLRQIVKRLERIASEFADQRYANAIQAHSDGLAQLADTLAAVPTGLNSLTPQQSRILAFIQQRTSKQGEAPTRKEIMSEFGFSSPNAAQEHVKALERKGLITVTGAARGIRVNKRDSTLTLSAAP